MEYSAISARCELENKVNLLMDVLTEVSDLMKEVKSKAHEAVRVLERNAEAVVHLESVMNAKLEIKSCEPVSEASVTNRPSGQLAIKQTTGLPDNKTISSELGKVPELKKYMKRAMPFVQATRENMERVGSEALSVGLPFDEAAVLEDNKQYLLSTLDLESIEVKHTDSEDAPEKTREDCAPGQPHVNFWADVGVTAHFHNPTPHNGLFSVVTNLTDGDTVEKIKAKIAKEFKGIIKDVSQLKLWRYVDPVMGPRKIPVPGDLETKCVILENSAVLKINKVSGTVQLVNGKENIDIGFNFLYTYDK